MVLWIVLDLDRFYSYSQVLEENGATDNGGKPTAHDCIRWIVVELLRWRNVEVEWGPVVTASSSVERRATLIDDANAAVVREGMHEPSAERRKLRATNHVVKGPTRGGRRVVIV